MKNNLITLLFLICYSFVDAQVCGTDPLGFQRFSAFNLSSGQELMDNSNFREVKEGQSILVRPVLTYNIHFIVVSPNKEMDVSEQIIEDNLVIANNLFMAADIQFRMRRKPTYVDSDRTTLNIHRSKIEEFERDFGRKYDKRKTINVYCFRQFMSNPPTPNLNVISVSGFALWPDSTSNRIFLNYGAFEEKNTLAHELGHYFGLLHTHGKEVNGTKELVDASNCSSTGDKICDTPADPKLDQSGEHMDCFDLANQCDYKYYQKDCDAPVDANNDRYEPDLSNIMSYYFEICRNKFSKGQLGRIRRVAETVRKKMIARVSLKKNNVSANQIKEYGFLMDAYENYNYEQRRTGNPYIGKNKALVLVYKDSITWCRRMRDDLHMNSIYRELFTEDYFLAIWDVDSHESDRLYFPTFFGNEGDFFAKPRDYLVNVEKARIEHFHKTEALIYLERAVLERDLTPYISSYPAILILEFAARKEEELPRILDYKDGYMKSEELYRTLLKYQREELVTYKK